MIDKKTLTTTAGAPVPDDQNFWTAGERAPILLQDYQLIEKLAHQNRRCASPAMRTATTPASAMTTTAR